MAKTRKQRQGRQAHLPLFANTMHGLQEWYRMQFEKVGWMVLWKAKGVDHRIVSYKKNITHLIESIKHVSAEYKDPDRKHDLAVLQMNAETLRDFVMAHF